ncbi:MAG: hypothetical protein ACOYXB_04200 [Bacteroidota bacterium]
MLLIKVRSTWTLVVIMLILAGAGILTAHFHYRGKNETVDPRIEAARISYERYNNYARANAFDSVFALMDSIEAIYSATEHYRESYEVGVLYNNRAAAFLAMALYSDSTVCPASEKDSLIELAEEQENRAIYIYSGWLDLYGEKSLTELEAIASKDFFIGLENYSSEQQQSFLKTRVKEIEEAQEETRRRLSVAFTNQGVIFRTRKDYDGAAECYLKAIELWDQNLTAENNLNILLGKPLKKRTFIQKLFPPDRN